MSRRRRRATSAGGRTEANTERRFWVFPASLRAARGKPEIAATFAAVRPPERRRPPPPEGRRSRAVHQALAAASGPLFRFPHPRIPGPRQRGAGMRVVPAPLDFIDLPWPNELFLEHTRPSCTRALSSSPPSSSGKRPIQAVAGSSRVTALPTPPRTPVWTHSVLRQANSPTRPMTHGQRPIQALGGGSEMWVLPTCCESVTGPALPLASATSDPTNDARTEAHSSRCPP